MARIAKAKTAAEVAALTAPEVVNDGKIHTTAVGHVPGLSLRTDGRGNASWVLRIAVNGADTWLGLGTYDPTHCGLVEARKRAIEKRNLSFSGVDPVKEKRERVEKELTERAMRRNFREVFEEFMLDVKDKELGNAKHKAQYFSTMETYVYPVIGTKSVALVDREDVKTILKPIYYEITETATRVLQRIRDTLNFAMFKGYRPKGDNPAVWEGNMQFAFPDKAKIQKVQHHAALALEYMRPFMSYLRRINSTSRHALEFLVYTVQRTENVLSARWEQIDFASATWRIPMREMKIEKNVKYFEVPLSSDALALLNRIKPEGVAGDAYIFPGAKPGQTLSNNAMLITMTKMRASDAIPHATPHGFRSTFEEWAQDEAEIAPEVSSKALAHKLQDKTEAAYKRSAMLKRRRPVMEAWAAYINERSDAHPSAADYAGAAVELEKIDEAIATGHVDNVIAFPTSVEIPMPAKLLEAPRKYKQRSIKGKPLDILAAQQKAA